MEADRKSSKLRSNVAMAIALLALSIALGGVSYAALKIPARSVGAKQLKTGAVGARALGVPIGSATRNMDGLGPVVEGGTCVFGSPPECGPPTLNNVLKVGVEAGRGGRLSISGAVTLAGRLMLGAEHGTASVEATLFVDDQRVPGTWKTTVVDDHVTVLPFAGSTRISSGRHVVLLSLQGVGFDYVNVDGLSGSISATLARDIAFTDIY